LRVGPRIIARRYSYQATGNQKAPQSLKAISPVAWQHIHFLGHYTFRDNRHPIDLDALLANVTLG
jgi:hypothetical protein